MTPTLQGLTCWLVDTRKLWHGDRIERVASEVLTLLPLEEQNQIRAKHFIADAKLSLASALLKRLYVSRTLGIPWDKVRYTRLGDPEHGKPAALDANGSVASIDFNVSHQASLVALIGSSGPELAVGVDIVCVNERDDYRHIDAEGFDAWIDLYQELFSDAERWDMAYNLDSITLLDGRVLSAEQIGRADRCVRRGQALTADLDGETLRFDSDVVIEAKLRRFYVFFAYKEAYVKLAGEALLAPWLSDLEFANVKSPRPGTVARCSVHGVWGQTLTDAEVSLKGKPLVNVQLTIQAFEENHMIATAVKGPGDLPRVPAFVTLDVENDILSYARQTINHE